MGGWIDVTSEEGRGSNFTFYVKMNDYSMHDNQVFEMDITE